MYRIFNTFTVFWLVVFAGIILSLIGIFLTKQRKQALIVLGISIGLIFIRVAFEILAIQFGCIIID